MKKRRKILRKNESPLRLLSAGVGGKELVISKSVRKGKGGKNTKEGQGRGCR